MKERDIFESLVVIIMAQLKEGNGFSKGDITREASFDYLGIDSLDKVVIEVAVKEEFGVHISDGEMDTIATVGGLMDVIIRRASAKSSQKEGDVREAFKRSFVGLPG